MKESASKNSKQMVVNFALAALVLPLMVMSAYSYYLILSLRAELLTFDLSQQEAVMVSTYIYSSLEK